MIMDEEDHPQLITSGPKEDEKKPVTAAPKPKLERAGTYSKDTAAFNVAQTQYMCVDVATAGSPQTEDSPQAMS